MRSKERSELIKTSVRLKQQEEIIEKTVDHFVNSMKLEPEILRGLKNERNCRTSERREFVNSLRSSVLEIVNSLRDVKSTMSGLEEGRRKDVDSFRTKLKALSDDIQSWKENCPLELLNGEQLELDRHLHSFSMWLIKYEAKNNPGGSVAASRHSSKPSSNRHNDDDRQDYREIQNFEALIAKTGHTENWTDEDHHFFLKARKSCPNVPAMVAVITKKCPDISAERIENHEAWYKIYIDLREAHRKAIEQWRNKKQLEKTQRLKIAMKTSEDKKNCGQRENNSNMGIVDEEPTSVEDCSKPNRKKELINRWRIDKENAKSVEQERAKSETELRRIAEENRRKARARRIKKTLSAWKEKKIETVTTTSSARSVADSDGTIDKSEGRKLVKLFRLQDEEFLKRRKSLLASKQPKSNVSFRQKMRTSTDGNSTLLKPTKVWLERCRNKETDPSGMSQQCLFVKDIPKLATCHRRNLESS